MSDAGADSAAGPQTPWDELLERSPVILSSACGTELQRRGVPTRLPLWSASALLAAPDAVSALHRDCVGSGARVVTANTFRTNRHALAAGGIGDRAGELTRLAVQLARDGVAAAGVDPETQGPILVAGSIGPVRDCYRPDLVPDGRTLSEEHAERAQQLAEAGVDLVLVETMNRSREAVVALEACRDAGLPALVSFVCTRGGRVLGGESLDDALRAVRPLAPRAVLVNCAAPDVTAESLPHLLASGEPAGIYANGEGRPDDVQGWSFLGGVGRSTWVTAARDAVLSGARLIGGCCGTSPAWISDLRAELTTLCSGHRQSLADGCHEIARHAIASHGALTPFGAVLEPGGRMLRVEPGEHVAGNRTRAIEAVRAATASRAKETDCVAAAMCTEVQHHARSCDRPFAIRLHIESRAGPPIDIVQSLSQRAEGSTIHGERCATESTRQLL